MRQITVSGFLGADPEIKTAKSGKNYASFRLSNHERNDDKDSTFWTNVVSMDTGGLIPHLKKGSGVVVQGDYSNHLYTSEKYGPQIDNTIIAWHIEFWGSKPKDGVAESEVRETVGTAMEKAQSAAPAPQRQAPAQQSPFVVNNTNDDELPF